MTADLIVYYEDKADWRQDSVIIKDVETPISKRALVQKVITATRTMFTPPSEHIRIVGYGPLRDDVSARGLVWYHDDCIFN